VRHGPRDQLGQHRQRQPALAHPTRPGQNPHLPLSPLPVRLGRCRWRARTAALTCRQVQAPGHQVPQLASPRPQGRRAVWARQPVQVRGLLAQRRPQRQDLITRLPGLGKLLPPLPQPQPRLHHNEHDKHDPCHTRKPHRITSTVSRHGSIRHHRLPSLTWRHWPCRYARRADRPARTAPTVQHAMPDSGADPQTHRLRLRSHTRHALPPILRPRTYRPAEQRER